MQADILIFRHPLALRLPSGGHPPSDVPRLDVNLPLILHKMGALESKAETRRLFKVLTNAMYALDILTENEWRDILNVLDPTTRDRRLP
jgi:hypothetical protein